jgi:sugar phosphate isomerase/epimerase
MLDRGIRIEALNCSGMPMHPVDGPRHRQLIYTTIELARELGVDKIVTMSGAGGDGPDASTVNWSFYPWPPSSVALAERQWKDSLELWTEIARFAQRHGVSRIALELHPVHLVYNVPTLTRLRDAVGEIIGATVDPSHLFWQQMDPVAVVTTLADALYHVQLKDTQLRPDVLAVAGVLDDRPFTGAERAWVQRTVGQGHDAAFWARFVSAVRNVGYTGGLSIENEDPHQSFDDGVREAAAMLRPLLASQ